jgi:hypothetical protein
MKRQSKSTANDPTRWPATTARPARTNPPPDRNATSRGNARPARNTGNQTPARNR